MVADANGKGDKQKIALEVKEERRKCVGCNALPTSAVSVIVICCMRRYQGRSWTNRFPT